MFNKNTQFINIIKSQQNIKINYQILNDNKIIKSEHSTFLFDNNEVSTDAKIKIASLNDKKKETFVSAVCENINQRIVTNDIPKNKEETSIYFDTKHNIVLENHEISNSLEFYGKDEVDYFISAYTILHSIMNDKLDEKSLNILIHNENLYAIILDENKRYVFSSIKKLPSYSDLCENEFFNDEISKQKLYEEMYLLQMQENISSIIEEFYNINNNSYFIENTNIYYTIKQLSDEQINILNKDLLLNIHYKQVVIDNHIFKMVLKPSIVKHSFTKVRKKETNKKVIVGLVLIFILSFSAAAGLYWYKQNEKNNLIKIKQEKLLREKLAKAKIEEIAMPNHKLINTNYKNFIVSIFDTIGTDSTLKEIKLLKDESTLVYNFTKENSYELNLKPALLKIYKNSENILTSKNNNSYTAIIANNNVKESIDTKASILYKPNKKYKKLLKKDIEKYLNKILTDSKIKYYRSYSLKYNSFAYTVTQDVKTPESFFDNIDKLNNQYYSIILKFPIEFIKSNNTIKIKYTLVFNQIKTSKK